MVVNRTLSPNANEMTLTVNGESIRQLYMIQIAAENELGQGPFSNPLEVEFDPLVLVTTSTSGSSRETEDIKGTRQVTLIIGVVSAAIFVLILISAVICYKRKLRSDQKPMGYLPASTSDDFHCRLNRQVSGPIIRNAEMLDKRHSKDTTNLWIERPRWGSDSCEKDSNSSEKKLLNNVHNHTHSNSNSDTEYAYVENKHNVSSFTNSSAGSAHKNRHTGAESPEPYATTDLFQKASQNHYAAPIIQYRTRNIHSCDDLTDSAELPHRNQHGNYYVPQNYQRASTGGHGKRGKPKNLLDMIPPPPLHPPPPPSIYNRSQESVISPKYLFAHPMYQGTANYGHKIHPSTSNRSHYEQVDNHHRIHHQPRLIFDRDCHDELQHFNAMLTQFSHQNQINPQLRVATPVRNVDEEYGHDNEEEACSSGTSASNKSNHY